MKSQKTWLTLVALLMVGFASQAAQAQSLIWAADAQQNDVIMQATYTELYYGNLVDQELEVRIWNAPANKKLKVIVRGKAIGVLETNNDGYGIFFKGRRAVPVGDDERPDAPRIETGDVIKVGQPWTNKFIQGDFVDV